MSISGKRITWEEKHKVDRKCLVCQRKFRAKLPRHFFCSAPCRNENHYRKTRRKTLEKKEGCCYICHSIDALHAHHIIQRSEGGIETVLLCEKHHYMIHRFMRMLAHKGYRIVQI